VGGCFETRFAFWICSNVASLDVRECSGKADILQGMS